MNEVKKSPQSTFVIAGILFLLSGIFSVLPSAASLFSMLTPIFDGYVGNFLGLLYNVISILSALSVCALGVVLLISRKNTKSVVITTGVTLILAAIPFIFSIASQSNTFIPIYTYSYTLSSSVYILLLTISDIVGICVPLLLFLLAIFNLQGNQKLCNLWFVPIIVKVFSCLLSLACSICQSWMYSSALFFDFADFIVGIIRYLIVSGLENLLGLLSIGFFCFALRRIVTEEPEKIEESTETEAIDEPIPSPETEI